MKKKIYKLTISLILILILVILYLSTVGIKTKKFNSRIVYQLNKIEPNIKIDIKEVSAKLNLFNFSIKAKTIGTDLIRDNKVIKLENITTTISIKSILDKKFAISQVSISTNSLPIKDFLNFMRLIFKDPKILIAEKFLNKGFIVLDLKLNFDEFGKIKNNYEIDGFVNDGQISLFRNKIDKLNFIFQITDKNLRFNDMNFSFNDKNIIISELNALKKEKVFLVSGKLSNDILIFKKNDFGNYIKNEFLKVNLKEITFSSDSDFSFEIDKNFRFKNFDITSNINLVNLRFNNIKKLKNFFPNTKENISFEDQKIILTYKENRIDIKGTGNIYLQKNPDLINYSISNHKDEFIFDTNLVISKNPLRIDLLNYQKKDKSTLNLTIKGKSNKDYFFFEKISLLENKNVLLLNNIKLSKKYKIEDIGTIKIDYKDKENLDNNFLISKENKKYKILGDSFNSNKIISDLLNSSNNQQNFFNKNFDLFLEIKKVHLDKNHTTKNLKGSLSIEKNKISKLDLEKKFFNKDKIKFSIKTTKNGEKITTLFSNKAKPFVGRYKFIKGFEDGDLDFYSIKKNGISNSTLKIDNFKVQEVPALAKILTLASLQGIADLLTGEGIRFTDFEMKFSSKGELMEIEELYAIGPAISILMEGYIQSEKLISLRGTLVPATTINRTISSIPLIGDILVGKKVGEGVFGVSFKIKGPPKNLQTSVNPIKTLTPRFITRTLQKLKKN